MHKRSRSVRVRRALVASAIGLVVAIVAAELALRFIVVSDSSLATKLGRALITPGMFFDPQSESDYWKLAHRDEPPPPAGHETHIHDRIGWIPHHADPRTLEHQVGQLIGGRRPVLLYGDSFAACATTSSECWDGLLDRSEFGGTHVLLNYGTGGYGADQILLLLRATIDHYVDCDPFVIVAFFADDDFHRSWLEFRGQPKPRLDLVDGQLVPRAAQLQPAADYLADHPIEPGFLLRRLLVQSESGPFEDWRRAERARVLETGAKVDLNRAIVEAAHAELERRGIDHAFLLFHGSTTIRQPDLSEPFDTMTEQVAANAGVRCVSSRPFLLAAGGPRLENLDALFFRGVAGDGHYRPRGNEVVFQAFLQLLRGSDGAREIEAARRIGASVTASDAGRVEPLSLRGGDGLLRIPEAESDGTRWFRRSNLPRDGEVWGLRVPPPERAPLELVLGPGVDLDVRMRLARASRGSTRAALEVRVDDALVETVELGSNETPLERAWHVAPDARLALRVRGLDGDFVAPSWLSLEVRR